MNREICLVVCFLLGMLIYNILKGVCGCDKVVEGAKSRRGERCWRNSGCQEGLECCNNFLRDVVSIGTGSYPFTCHTVGECLGDIH